MDDERQVARARKKRLPEPRAAVFQRGAHQMSSRKETMQGARMNQEADEAAVVREELAAAAENDVREAHRMESVQQRRKVVPRLVDQETVGSWVERGLQDQRSAAQRNQTAMSSEEETRWAGGRRAGAIGRRKEGQGAFEVGMIQS